MLTIQTGRAQDTNNPRFRESAAEYARFSPPSGLKLTVGMVSDSVRGNRLGPEAAIAGAMKILSESSETQIPLLLHSAFETSHKVIRRVGLENNIQLAATLTVALIVNDERLFVANLGHSRIYLYRANASTFEQLTLEHNFANVSVLEGRMLPRDAVKHPDAKMLTRYIGTPTLIQPDMNIYADSESSNLVEAEKKGREGLVLQPHDVVLITTDGLTQAGRGGGAIITIDDIVRAISQDDARQAALEIVETAYRQHPTNTISIVVMKAIPELAARLRVTWVTLLSIIALLVLLVLVARVSVFFLL